jgi:hypothetical protein
MSRRRSRPVGYFAPSTSVAVGLVALMPILAAYEVTVFFANPRSQATAGLLLRRLFALIGPNGFLLFNAAMLTSFVVALVFKRRNPETRRFDLYPLIILEGMIYGFVLGPALSAILGPFRPLASGMGAGYGMALGAGAAAYEEILFRLVFIGGGLSLFRGMRRFDRMLMAVILVLASSAAFSLFHHVGAGAEIFEIRVALFRFVAGLLLAGLFVLRGLGVTVYTHAAYNAFILLG